MVQELISKVKLYLQIESVLAQWAFIRTFFDFSAFKHDLTTFSITFVMSEII